jgi:hypothetical protein
MTIAKPAFGTLEGFQKLIRARGIGQGEPEGLQARYVADVGDGIRVVAVWGSKQHAARFLEERLAPALATAFDEPQVAPRCFRAKSRTATPLERVPAPEAASAAVDPASARRLHVPKTRRLGALP